MLQPLLAKHPTTVFLNGLSDNQFKEKMQTSLSDLITDFNKAFSSKKKPSLSEATFRADAKQALLEMWDVKSFICPESELILNVIRRTDGLYEVRNIPILYETKSKNAQDDQIVIVFDTRGIIQGILIALEKDKYTQMFADAYTLQDRRLREIILNFLENFRTSYNRKDIDYIERVFSDDALIIVGRVISQNKELPDKVGAPELANKGNIEYVKLDKTKYISNLRSVFQKNKFVKVEFNDFKIQRHPTHQHFYGVQLIQKWRSSSYGDDGYLFLLLDLRNEDEPIIWVRTWQPDEHIKPHQAFDLADFTLN